MTAIYQAGWQLLEFLALLAICAAAMVFIVVIGGSWLPSQIVGWIATLGCTGILAWLMGWLDKHCVALRYGLPILGLCVLYVGLCFWALVTAIPYITATWAALTSMLPAAETHSLTLTEAMLFVIAWLLFLILATLERRR